MPLIVLKKVEVNSYLAVWKIDESLETLKLILGQHSKSDPEPISKVPAVLMQWLATRICLKLTVPGSFILQKTEEGAPFLINSDWNISMSHTKGWAAVLVSMKPCGIDIETMNDRAEKIADRFTDNFEWKLCPGDTKSEKLLWLWCAKEAGFKLYGKGQVIFKDNLLIEKNINSGKRYLYNTIVSEQYNIQSIKVDDLLIVWALNTPLQV